MEAGTAKQDGAAKRSLDELSKEELVIKCKNLLILAQKAKQAKTDVQNELGNCQLRLEKCESEKNISNDNAKTLQEMVNSLTEQKLTYITELDSTQNKIKVLEAKCHSNEETIQKCKAELILKEQQVLQVNQKLSTIDTEIISLKRQNKRLLEENEQLINQLSELEARTEEFNKIGLQQHEQLQALEERVSIDDTYKTKIQELNNTIKQLESRLDTTKDVDTYEQQIKEYELKVKDMTEKYELEKLKKDKANIKLKSYKDKILKCAACINQLKNSRFILTKTVKEYSDNIPKWQADLLNASRILDRQLNDLNEDNKSLKEKLHQLEQQNSKESKDNADGEVYKSKVDELYEENNKLLSQVTILEQQTNELNSKNNELVKKLGDVKLKYQDLIESELPAHVSESKALKDQLNEATQKIIGITNENCILKNTLKELEELKLQYQELNDNKLPALVKENEGLRNELQETTQKFTSAIHEKDILHHSMKEMVDYRHKYDELNDNELPSQINENKALKEQLNEATCKLTSAMNENDIHNNKVKELEDENQKLNQSLINKTPNCDVIENLNLQIKSLESEKAMLVKEKFGAKDSVVELENDNKRLIHQVNAMKAETLSLKSQLDSLSQEKAVLETNCKTGKEGEINNLKINLNNLQEQYNSLKKEHDNLQDLNTLLKEKVETLKLSLEQPKDDAEHLSDLNVSLQTDIVKLETKLNAYKQENASLLSEMKESRAKIKEYDALVAENEESKSKLAGYKTENNELLHEMKEINQVLKERGESISKLEKTVAEMERHIETLEKDKDSISNEQEDLQKQIVILKSDLNNAANNTCKSGEVTENLIAERDEALKYLAEKEVIITSLREEIEKLKQQHNSELPNEDMSSSTISRVEEAARMKDLDDSFEDKYSKLRMFALKLKKKLNETTTQLQNAEEDKAKLEKLLDENGAGDKKAPISFSRDEVDGVKIDVNFELEKVKGQLTSKIKELAAEIEAHKVTKEELEKAKRELKKKNVLSLEIEDYERSMKELTIKMEDNKKKIVQMESTIDTQEGTITAMKTQIKLLEEQIKADEQTKRLVKEELQRVTEISNEKDNTVMTKNDIISNLEQALEDEKRKNEESDLEMTVVLSEKEKIIMNLAEEKAELNNKLKKMEFKYSELNEKLKITDIELADLKTEYTSYKVRAQAVLRQNQTVDHSQEEQLKEEAAALKAQIESLTAKLTAAQDESTSLRQEVEGSRRRVSEATTETARAQQRTARLQADLTRIGQQIETERAQHKLQISTLTQCYKTQINELEAKLQRETEALRKQLSNQESVKSLHETPLDSVNHNQYMLPIPKEEDDGEMDINVSMIPREEGEGSESAPSPPLSKSYLSGASGRSPVPLDRLLEEGVPEDEDCDAASLSLTQDQEIMELRRKLQAQQQRVKHVTVLLSESERECARMAQLAELLKSELRRVRGSSANPNTEYMKNVTLKFLTLPPGDERSRLVPVLQKILTLTSDELHKINAIAKGQDPASKGWGSYLPWPGGK